MQIDNSRQMASAKFIYWLIDIFGFTFYAGSFLSALFNVELWKAIPMAVCGVVWMYYKIQEKREDIRKKRLENDKFERDSK